MRAAAFRRTSSLTGTDSQPDSRSWPRVAGRDMGPAHVDVGPTGVTWTLAGAARAFIPGKYHVGSPIAIGSGGLATPHDEGTDFTADDHTVLTTTPGVVLHLDSPTLLLDGPGS